MDQSETTGTPGTAQPPADERAGVEKSTDAAATPDGSKKRKANPFTNALNRFLTNIDSLAGTLPLAMASVQAAQKTSVETLKKFVEENGTTEKVGETENLMMPAEHWQRFKRLLGRRSKFAMASRTVPNSFLVALVSQFDAFVGDLIRVLFEVKPDTLDVSEKPLTFAQLREFSSIDEARNYVLEKEIESVLRKSHTEQFEWLESKFGLPLRKGLESWCEFIEITERRNLLVHTGGVVSSQYLAVCKQHKAKVAKDAVVGKVLRVTQSYFDSAYEVMFEVGVKLVHVLWRKVRSEERALADANLSDVCYDLLEDGRYRLAKEILDFATCVLKQHSSDEVRRRLIVNRAQAYKWLGEEAKAREIMQAEDWSATHDMFRLADAVLRDDFEIAGALMERVVGDAEKGFYRDWPLFREFRKTEIFAKKYEELFGEPFNRVAGSAEELESIVSESVDAKPGAV